MSPEKYAGTLSSPTGPDPRADRVPVQVIFERFADRVTRWTGSLTAFFLAVVLLLVWALCGPWFHYSETWQLVVNTGTTIVTFLMVFVIQQSQNKDSHALHLKLDELLSSIKTADNALIDIEHLDAKDLDRISHRYAQFAQRRRDKDEGEEAPPSAPPEAPASRRLKRRRDRLAQGLAGFRRQRSDGGTAAKPKGVGKSASGRRAPSK